MNNLQSQEILSKELRTLIDCHINNFSFYVTF